MSLESPAPPLWNTFIALSVGVDGAEAIAATGSSDLAMRAPSHPWLRRIATRQES